MIGKNISHYKIVEKLGEGGMGVVYKAQDTKLDRFVALKFLPPHLGQAEEEKKRFVHEAKSASRLQHNNICTIHEIGDTEDGQMFICMDYYEGETLKEKIERGPLTLEETFNIVTHVGQGLARAHEEDIVHRDIKPSNIMITNRNEVKIVDFGLAKLSGRTQLTKEGTTLGTVAYMSPEQAQGAEVDHRTDIWAVGVLLYEMLTGQQPFKGDYETAVVYSILHEEPEPISHLRAEVSPQLEAMVNKTLAKDADDRYESVPALLDDLETLETHSSGRKQRPATKNQKTGRPVKMRSAVGTMGILTIAAILFAYLQLSPKESTLRLTNPRQLTSAVGAEVWPTWSPDGSRIAYVSKQSGNYDIWVTQVGGGEPVNLTKDHLGIDHRPSWSPDGDQIAFRSDRDGDRFSLASSGSFIMSALGGAARKLGLQGLVAPQWSSDGKELASVIGIETRDSTQFFVEIMSLSNDSSRRLPLPGKKIIRLHLSWSPDNRMFAYVDATHTSAYPAQIWVLRTQDGQAFPVTYGRFRDTSPSWSADGRTLFFVSNRGGSYDIWQQRLTKTGKADGVPQALTTGIGIRSRRNAAFSPDGTKVVYSKGRRVANVWRVPIPAENNGPKTWTDAQQVTFDQAEINFVDISPDGERLLLTSDRVGNMDLWVMPVAGGGMQQLTTDSTREFNGKWSPDGREIVFNSDRSGNVDIFVMPAAGGASRQLTNYDGVDSDASWAPDGQRIVFSSGRNNIVDLWVVPSAGGEARRLTDNPGHDYAAEWSPDGTRIAFVSMQTGERSLWLMQANGQGAELLIPKNPYAKCWSPDGKRIYFVISGEHDIWEISLEDGSERRLTNFVGRPGIIRNAMTTDGKHLFFVWVEEIGDLWVMDVEKDE